VPAEEPPATAPASVVGLGDDVVPLPGELALLSRVALPLRSRRQRQAAVGYAIEDTIAEPLEAVHVVLGAELGPGEHLAVVVSRGVMDEWARRVGGRQRLVPDTLALPIPAEGTCAMRETSGRVLVRRADGTGYVAAAATVAAFWRADGSPQIVLYGGRLPDDVPIGATGLLPPRPDRELARFDLLRGPYARGADVRRAARRIGALVAAVLAAHAALVAADTVALRRIADAREAALRAELSARLPDLPASVPLDAAMRRVAPEGSAPVGGGFLPLMTRVSDALAPLAGQIASRSLAYDAEASALTISIEAADLATLQQAEESLRVQGLAVTSGVATTAEGLAKVQLVVGGAG
jgi:general secretion pathway protein L